jgi:hypothetical protein
MKPSQTGIPPRPTPKTLFFLYNVVRMTRSRITKAVGWTRGQIGGGIRRWELTQHWTVRDEIGMQLGDRVGNLLHFHPNGIRHCLAKGIAAGNRDWVQLAEAMPEIDDVPSWSDEGIWEWMRPEYRALFEGRVRRRSVTRRTVTTPTDVLIIL